MIASDIITRVQRIFGDDAGTQITSDDIIRWINDGQEEIVINNEGLLETNGTISSIAGQATYSLPADCSVLRSIQYNGYALKAMSLNDFNLYLNGFNDPNQPYGKDIPIVYTVWNNTITLFPTPAVAVVNGINFYYIKHPVAVVNTSDALGVPVQYHKALVDYCLSQAYELDEDSQKAVMKTQQFEQAAQKLNDRNKWINQEVYPSITKLPQDANYESDPGWFSGGYY
jgi:hypothetical protein